MKITISIVNYGMGNLYSIKKQLDQLGITSVITNNVQAIKQADKIILPGVGHFAQAMKNIKAAGLDEVLNEQILFKKKPVLGICLGMQLMANFSEEGDSSGLGWIDANVVRFKVSNTLTHKIPHMGWNTLYQSKESLLSKGISSNDEFYFVHSYYLEPKNPCDILFETDYESQFCSAIEKDNIFGVQFHPEKSHQAGTLLLNNFIKL